MLLYAVVSAEKGYFRQTEGSLHKQRARIFASLNSTAATVEPGEDIVYIVGRTAFAVLTEQRIQPGNGGGGICAPVRGVLAYSFFLNGLRSRFLRQGALDAAGL